MRWRRITFWVSLSMLALVVLALTWLWTADLGVFRPQIERLVTEKTGREFSINGDFIVDFNRHPTVIAKDMRFRNPEWAEDPHMVAVGRAEVRIDLWSLVSGPFIIEFVDIDDVDVQLLNPQDKEPNWVFTGKEPAAIEEEDTDSAGIDLLIEELYVDNVAVLLESAERERPLQLQLDKLRQSSRADGMLEFSLDAILDGRVVKAEGETGTWEALLAGRDVRFDLEAVLDTFEFTGSGLIDSLAEPKQPEFSFTAQAPDIDDLTRLLGLGDEGSGNIDFSGSLAKTPDGMLQLELNGNIGQTTIQSLGTLSDLQSLRDIDFDVTASGPDLGRILRLAGIHQVREAPFMLRVDAKTQEGAFIIHEGNMVFGEAQIDIRGKMPKFPSVDDAVVTLDIKGPDIARFRYLTGMPGAAEGAFSLGFTIDVAEDGLEILQLDIETGLGELRGTGKLGHPPEFYGSTFDVRVSGDDLRRITTAYGIEGLPEVPFEVLGAIEYIEGGLRTREPVAATVGDVSATLDGFLPFTRGIIGTEATFATSGPDLSRLIGAFTEAEGVPEQPFDIGGLLQVREDGYRFSNVSGNVGTSAVTGDGLLKVRDGLAGTRFTFAAKGPAFEELTTDVDIEVREGPYELSGRIGLQRDLIEFDEIKLERKSGHVSLNADLGLPVSELRVRYDAQASGPDVRDLLARLGPFELKALPFSIDARGEVDVDYVRFDEFDVTVGDATTESQGEIRFADEENTSQLRWSGNLPSLARIVTLDGKQLNDQSFYWSADLVGDGKELKIENLLLKIGESDIRGRVHITAGDVPELDVDVYSDSIIVAPLVADEEDDYDPEPEFENGRLIPDTPIPFEALKKLNATLDIDIRELQRKNLLMKDIEFDATLQDGALDITNASFKARAGALVSRARLEPTGDSGKVEIELVARQFALGMAKLNIDLAMTQDVDINLAGEGGDLRALLGSANGEFFIDARGGRIAQNRVMQRLYGDLLQEILSTINPFRETDPYTDFECIVLPIKFDDGVATAAPRIFISTSKIRMMVTPSINLKTEDLQINVRTTPRRVLSLSAGELLNPYVQVVGTLAAPRLAVDETGLLISGGAAVATGGLSILARGVWDRLSRSGNACGQASSRAIDELGERFPDLAIEGLGRIK
jgi:uncharacterized protein involved in outer membrane biogenesis